VVESQGDFESTPVRRGSRTSINSKYQHCSHQVTMVCNDSDLFDQWQKDIKVMATRVASMRKRLYDLLVEYQTAGDWSHILTQQGMFAYSGLTPAQTERLTNEYHIYVPPTGRLSISGLNPGNLHYVARAFAEVCESG